MAEVPVTRTAGLGDDSFAWLDMDNTDTGELVVVRGGQYAFALQGDASLQWSPDGTNLFDVTGFTPLDDECTVITLADGFVSVTAGADNTSVWLRYVRNNTSVR